MTRAKEQVPPEGPERETDRDALMVAQIDKLSLMPGFLTTDDKLALARQMVAHALGEPDTRTPAERERQSALIDRVADVLPSIDPRDAVARAQAVEDHRGAEAVEKSVEEALDVAQRAEAEASAKLEAATRRKEEMAALVAKRDPDKRKRVENRLDLEDAEEELGITEEAFGVAKAKVVELRSAREAAAVDVQRARARVAVIDLRAEARVLKLEQVSEDLRRAQHAQRVQVWMAKLDAHAPPDVNVPVILMEMGVIEAPRAPEQEIRVPVMVAVGSLEAAPRYAELTAAELEVCARLGLQVLAVENLMPARNTGVSPFAAMQPMGRSIELPSRQPEPVPEGSSNHLHVVVGPQGPSV